jgi:hypothetical protein
VELSATVTPQLKFFGASGVFFAFNGTLAVSQVDELRTPEDETLIFEIAFESMLPLALDGDARGCLHGKLLNVSFDSLAFTFQLLNHSEGVDPAFVKQVLEAAWPQLVQVRGNAGPRLRCSWSVVLEDC